jgi:hypothetical protein
VHLIIGTEDQPIETIMRDYKRHTSEAIHRALLQEGESRGEWMRHCSGRRALPTATTAASSYGSRIIIL